MNITYKVALVNNYIVITSDDSPDFLGVQGPAESVTIIPTKEDAERFEFWGLDNSPTMWDALNLNQILDSTGTPFTLGTWTTFYTTNTGSGGVSTAASLGEIEADIDTLVSTQNVGTVTTGILAPALPYTIADATYNSFTIIPTGLVSIEGIPVTSGVSYSYSCQSNEKLTGLELTTPGGGTVVILTQQKS